MREQDSIQTGKVIRCNKRPVFKCLSTTTILSTTTHVITKQQFRPHLSEIWGYWLSVNHWHCGAFVYARMQLYFRVIMDLICRWPTIRQACAWNWICSPYGFVLSVGPPIPSARWENARNNETIVMLNLTKPERTRISRRTQKYPYNVTPYANATETEMDVYEQKIYLECIIYVCLYKL